MDPTGEGTEAGFFDFEIDTSLPERVDRFHVFESTDDADSIVQSVDMIRAALPHVRFHSYTDMGHFTFGDMGTRQFPDLLHALVD